jgi:hypothetical protein
MYHSNAYGTRGTNQRRYLNSCLPMGTMAANWKSEDFGTSPFFEQLFRQVSACLYMAINGRAVDKEQWESSTFVSRSPCSRLVDRTALDRRPARPEPIGSQNAHLRSGRTVHNKREHVASCMFGLGKGTDVCNQRGWPSRSRVTTLVG